MTTQKSRKNPRAPVTLLARYRSPTAFEYVEERCYDLSSGGMFIESNTPAPAGTLIKLECDVNQGAGTLRGVARVVWLREQEGDGQPRGMGVKFLKLEPGSRELIMELLGERASLPPAESIPPSRRSWAGSVAPQSRVSGGPAAGASHAPSRPSMQARPETAARTVSLRPEVDASELSEVASARPRSAAPEPAATQASSAPNEALSSASSIDAAVSAMAAASAEVSAPATQPTEPAPLVPVTKATIAGIGPEPAAATTHAAQHDHRPHAHELRERLARRAAAQRAAAAAGAQAATPAVEEHAATPTAAAAVVASAAPAATSAAAPQPTATDAKQGWTEPARALEPATPATAARAPAAAAATSAAASVPTEPAQAATDERRAFALKGDVPVEEMAKGRGVIYLGLIAACVALILVLQMRKPPAPETAAPIATAPEPAVVAAPVQLPPVVEPAPAAAPQPVDAPTAAAAPYVLDVSTTPEGATVTVGNQSGTTPAKLALGVLEAPITVRVHKDGFEPATVELDLAGFALKDGEHRRSVALSLTASAPPPTPPKVAAAKPEPPPKAPAAKPSASSRPRREPAAQPKPAEPVAAEPAAPAPTPAPAAPTQTPLEIATACLAAGDNICVLRALEGKANGPRELEMVVETHRAMGNGTKAEQLMQSYVEKYPTERRAMTYKRLLDRKLGTSAAPAAGSAPAPAEPAPAP
jgi:uncharacterized protein (TIGR02266 family)